MKVGSKHLLLMMGLSLSLALVGVWRSHPPAATLPRFHQFSIDIFPITSADLQHGCQQVDRMMRDREAMAQVVKRGDAIYEWATRQFAGELTGQRIFWSAGFETNMPAEYLAYNHPPSLWGRGSISIREVYAEGPLQGKKIESDALWSCAVYELFNVANYKGFAALHEEATKGTISKEDYIKANAQLEFLAIQRTRAFYHKFYRPWRGSQATIKQPELWYADEPSSYEEWIRQYSDPEGYPYKYYGEDYDQITGNYTDQLPMILPIVGAILTLITGGFYWRRKRSQPSGEPS